MCTLLGARRLSDVPLKKRGGKSTFKGTDPEQKIFYQLTRIKTATPDHSCIYQQHAGVLTLSPSLCIVVSTLAKTESVSTGAQTAVRRKTISFLAPLNFARATGRKNEQQIAATKTARRAKSRKCLAALFPPRGYQSFHVLRNVCVSSQAGTKWTLPLLPFLPRHPEEHGGRKGHLLVHPALSCVPANLSPASVHT